MGKVVAISGGDLSSTQNLSKYIVTLSEKENPKFLFIPTASQDFEGYISKIHEYFEPLGCEVNELCLITKTYSSTEIEEMINDSDIIYVGGGNTVSMIEKWKEYDVDKYLIKAYKKGTVLSGISAGAICWFECGHSDSDKFSDKDNWSYIWANGLNFYHAAFCPHYDQQGRDSFDYMIADKNIPGFALENDIAFIEIDGEFKIIKENKKAHAYKILYSNGKKVKVELLEDVSIEV